jgi:hypothetical protein
MAAVRVQDEAHEQDPQDGLLRPVAIKPGNFRVYAPPMLVLYPDGTVPYQGDVRPVVFLPQPKAQNERSACRNTRARREAQELCRKASKKLEVNREDVVEYAAAEARVNTEWAQNFVFAKKVPVATTPEATEALVGVLRSLVSE